jgi:hypothetical protein
MLNNGGTLRKTRKAFLQELITMMYVVKYIKYFPLQDIFLLISRKT